MMEVEAGVELKTYGPPGGLPIAVLLMLRVTEGVLDENTKLPGLMATFAPVFGGGVIEKLTWTPPAGAFNIVSVGVAAPVWPFDRTRGVTL
jgi:hypothetical protein